MIYKIIQQTFVKVAKVLRFCGPPSKMKRGLMIPKQLNAWMNHHINQSLRYLFDFWPTRVAKVVHVSSLMKGIVRELIDLLLTPDTPHEHGTYLLFRDECRCGRHSFWPDLCAYIVMMLGGYWVEGCLEKQNSRNGILGCFLRAAVYMAEETSGQEEYIQKPTWRRCNAILHSMQPWTLNPKVNPTLSLPLFFFFASSDFSIPRLLV